MNQDEVRDKLLRLRSCAEPFAVIFSGKKSKRINGLYKPSRKEIIIHNLNFINDEGALDENALIYTAIHELAHHVQFTELGERGTRCHTQLFWSCFHDLLAGAERQGTYRLEPGPEAEALAEKARKLSSAIAALQRELGKALMDLGEACRAQGVRYEDVVQRTVQLTPSTARKAVEAATLGIHEGDEIGVDQQAAALGARSPEAREAMLAGAREGKTVEQIKRLAVAARSGPEERLDRLERERERLERTIHSLERTIHSLEHRLSLVKIQLADLAQGPPGAEQREAS
jgi:prefoldin subunit 5